MSISVSEVLRKIQYIVLPRTKPKQEQCVGNRRKQDRKPKQREESDLKAQYHFVA